MAYNQYLADRIHQRLKDLKVAYRTIKMMGGLCFMIDEKMSCGILYSKKKDMDVLMARIGPEAYEAALDKEGCYPMDFTGRPMKGYVFIGEEGFDIDEDLDYWIQLCIEFNPRAKSSKKK